MLTTVLPSGRRSGGEIGSQGVADALRRSGMEVRIVGYRRSGDDDVAAPGEIAAGTRPIETSRAGARAAMWGARALLTGDPYSVAKYRSRAYVETARRALDDGVEAVIADHAQVRFALSALDGRDLPIAFYAHNAEARYYEGLAHDAGGRARRGLAARESRLIRAVELDVARRARQVWAVTEDDAAWFREHCPGADLRLLRVCAQRTASGEVPEAECDVVLIGSWSWEANRLGLEWFADAVVPRLPRDLTVRIAGAGADWLRGSHPNLEVAGRVPDAERFLGAARVVAVPSVGGGGLQVKTLDAIASGVPVVATSLAVRGLGPLPASVAVAADAAEFAAELERLAAAEGARTALRAEALAWSDARRARRDAEVGEWIGELTGRRPSTSAPALVAEGSAPRLP
jgi:glycosyltransferase involved in cell wall biosynthesis